MTMTLIQTITFSGSSNSVEFANIPQTFTDLVCLISARTTSTSKAESLGLTFNNVFSGYTERRLRGTGSSVISDSAAYRTIGLIPGSTDTANTFGNCSVYIPNYTSSVAKSASGDSVTEHNGTEAHQAIVAYGNTLTAAVTSVLFDTATQGQPFVAGSTFSLYGILKGSSGGVVVS